MNLSWSSIHTFMKCQRAFGLRYIEGFVRNTDQDNFARLLGSAVHAGLEEALRTDFQQSTNQQAYGISQIVQAATHRAYIYCHEIQKDTPDMVTLVDAVYNTAVDVLKYQIPMIGIGSRYRVASVMEVLGHVSPDADLVPFVEFSFSYPLDADTNITGIIDAAVVDQENGGLYLLDWKVRENLVEPMLVSMDGQLPLYAALMTQMGASIRGTIQYQMLSSVPRPAVITEKTRLPSKAAQATTWEVWAQSIRAWGIDPEPYREAMMPKLRTNEDYVRPVVTPLNTAMIQRTMENLVEVVATIHEAQSLDRYPGIMSAHGCRFCDYKSVCRAWVAGASSRQILSSEYHVDLERIAVIDEGA